MVDGKIMESHVGEWREVHRWMCVTKKVARVHVIRFCRCGKGGKVML